MEKNKGILIVFAGTDCSGKQTQSENLYDRLSKEGISIVKEGFPNYDSPTGKIVGGPYLGKEHISEGIFPEGASNVDPLVAACYYAADRRYNMPEIKNKLNEGSIVLLDRYVESNMAHQGGQIDSKEERLKIYNKLETLEYDVLELPRPDMTVFLYMPYQYSVKLKAGRAEKPDQLESSTKHLLAAERAYLELAEMNGWIIINCVENDEIKTIDQIHEEVYMLVKQKLEKNKEMVNK